MPPRRKNVATSNSKAGPSKSPPTSPPPAKKKGGRGKKKKVGSDDEEDKKKPLIGGKEKTENGIWRTRCDLTRKKGALIFGAHHDAFKVSSHNPRCLDTASQAEKDAMMSHQKKLKVDWTGAEDKIVHLGNYEPENDEFQLSCWLGFVDTAREPDPDNFDDREKMKKVEARFQELLEERLTDLAKRGKEGTAETSRVIFPDSPLQVPIKGKTDDELLQLDNPPFRFFIAAGQHRYRVSREIWLQSQKALAKKPNNEIFESYLPYAWTKVLSWELFDRPGSVGLVTYGTNRDHNIAETNVLSIFRQIDYLEKTDPNVTGHQISVETTVKEYLGNDSGLATRLAPFKPALSNPEMRPTLCNVALNNWVVGSLIIDGEWHQVEKYMPTKSMWTTWRDYLKALDSFTTAVIEVAQTMQTLAQFGPDDATRIGRFFSNISLPVKPTTEDPTKFEPDFDGDRITSWDDLYVQQVNKWIDTVKSKAPIPVVDDEMTYSEEMETRRMGAAKSVMRGMSGHLMSTLRNSNVAAKFRKSPYFQHGCIYSQDEERYIFRPFGPYDYLRYVYALVDLRSTEIDEKFHITLNGTSVPAYKISTKFKGTTAARMNHAAGGHFNVERLAKVGMMDPRTVREVVEWRGAVSPECTPKPPLEAIYSKDHPFGSNSKVTVAMKYRTCSPNVLLPDSLLESPWMQRYINALADPDDRRKVRAKCFGPNKTIPWAGRPQHLDKQFYDIQAYFGGHPLVTDPSFPDSIHAPRTTSALANKFLLSGENATQRPQSDGESDMVAPSTKRRKSKGKGKAEELEETPSRGGAKDQKGKGKQIQDKSPSPSPRHQRKRQNSPSFNNFLDLSASVKGQTPTQTLDEDEDELADARSIEISDDRHQQEIATFHVWARDAFESLLQHAFNIDFKGSENRELFDQIFDHTVDAIIAYDPSLKCKPKTTDDSFLTAINAFLDFSSDATKHVQNIFGELLSQQEWKLQVIKARPKSHFLYPLIKESNPFYQSESPLKSVLFENVSEERPDHQANDDKVGGFGPVTQDGINKMFSKSIAKGIVPNSAQGGPSANPKQATTSNDAILNDSQTFDTIMTDPSQSVNPPSSSITQTTIAPTSSSSEPPPSPTQPYPSSQESAGWDGNAPFTPLPSTSKGQPQAQVQTSSIAPSLQPSSLESLDETMLDAEVKPIIPPDDDDDDEEEFPINSDDDFDLDDTLPQDHQPAQPHDVQHVVDGEEDERQIGNVAVELNASGSEGVGSGRAVDSVMVDTNAAGAGGFISLNSNSTATAEELAAGSRPVSPSIKRRRDTIISQPSPNPTSPSNPAPKKKQRLKSPENDANELQSSSSLSSPPAEEAQLNPPPEAEVPSSASGRGTVRARARGRGRGRGRAVNMRGGVPPGPSSRSTRSAPLRQTSDPTLEVAPED